MLCLYDRDIDNGGAAVNFQKYAGTVFDDAREAVVSREINGDRTLSFKLPKSSAYIECVKPMLIVMCEDQPYRIIRVSRSADGDASVTCRHVYNADAPKAFIPNLGSTDTSDTIGISPCELAELAMESVNIGTSSARNSDLKLFTQAELEALGMSWIGYADGFLLDYESTDKTNIYDVMQQIIENCGRGELYADGGKFAIVERLGRDRTDVLLTAASNMTQCAVETDAQGIITRLYPYGRDGMEITNASANAGKTDYIDSDNTEKYGVCAGFKDYGDYTEPDKILENAMWEFDADNPDRIDVPQINITGTLVPGYMREHDLKIGDRVRVLDHGESYYERIISMEYYPYESRETKISLGHVRKDMFFYLNQLGALAKRYKSVSVSSGKIIGKKITGTVKATATADAANSADTANTARSVSNSAARLSDGLVSLYGAEITADADGNLCIDGKRIMVETGE